jgi:hypothetical protein
VILKNIFSLLLLLLLLSCARTVSSKPSIGSQLKVIIDVEGDFKIDQRFAIVVSNTSTPVLPADLPSSGPFMFYPGISVNDWSKTNLIDLSDVKTSDNAVIDYYYQHYFSSWSDILLIEPNSDFVSHFKSSLDQFPVTMNLNDHQQISQQSNFNYKLDVSSSLLTLLIDMDLLKSKVDFNKTIYFQLFSLDSEHIMVDHNDDTSIGQIINQTGELIEDTDLQGDVLSGTDEGLNIIFWRVEIF